MDITPAIHLKNEEYWVFYVLRDLLKVFGHVIMIDTGSTDNTIGIAHDIARDTGGFLQLIREDMGNDALRIGNCPNRLREMVEADWMLLVDGDEIWQEDQLRALAGTPAPEGMLVGMCNGRNLMQRDDVLYEREGFSADRLFARDVRWNARLDYPFQSHGLEKKCAEARVFHTNFELSYFWHVRHLPRSSKDAETYYRTKKKDFFPSPGRMEPLQEGWLVMDPRHLNPVLEAMNGELNN
jgi:glycosyltransferase involved in cell wall biosynthesis